MKFLGEYLKSYQYLHTWTLIDNCSNIGRPKNLDYWLKQHSNATILTISQYAQGNTVCTTIWYKEDER